ncbi:hypothetical protein ACJDT4_01640 [Clostridium neuense]|uniref:Uncharacterized protein n=1 Tax=Clostridium neuense TaxID=1728934 RepID=A0ABW8T997_9CLOT
MKKSFIKKICTFTLTCALLVGTISGSVFAKNRDFYNTNTKKIYTISSLSDSEFSDFINDVMSNEDKFVYEFGGKYYSYTSLLNDFQKNKIAGLDTATAFKNCIANTANVQSNFDPSAYSSTGNNDSSDFSVISID